MNITQLALGKGNVSFRSELLKLSDSHLSGRFIKQNISLQSDMFLKAQPRIPYLKKDAFGLPVEERFTLEDILTSSDVLYSRELEARQKKNPFVHLSDQQLTHYANQYYAKYKSASQDKTYTIVMGLPGSGKSTLTRKLKKDNRAIILNSDLIKRSLPGFRNGEGSQAVHEASRTVSHQVLELALARRKPVVHETTGQDVEGLITWLKMAKKEGYKTSIFLVDIPNQEAVKRIIQRTRVKDAKGISQYTPPQVVLNAGNKPRLAFEHIAKQCEQEKPLLDSYAVFDNAGDKIKLFDAYPV